MIDKWQQLGAEMKADMPNSVSTSQLWLCDLALKIELLLIESIDESLSLEFQEVKPILEDVLCQLRDCEETEREIRVLFRAARWAHGVGSWDFARELYERIITTSSPDTHTIQVHALAEVGDIFRKQGQFALAEQNYNRALEIARDNHLYSLHAHALNNLGVIEIEKGDLNLAENKFREALDLLVSSPEMLLEAHIYNNLGVLQCIRGKADVAYVELSRALSLRKRVGDSLGFAEACHNLGLALIDLERYQEAEDYLESALKAARELKRISLVANVLLSRADLLSKLSLFDISLKCAREALEILNNLDDPLGIGDAKRLSGLSLFKLGETKNARMMLEDAAQIAENHSHPQGIAQSREILVELELADGNVKKARSNFDNAYKAYQILGNQRAMQRLQELNKTY